MSEIESRRSFVTRRDFISGALAMIGGTIAVNGLSEKARNDERREEINRKVDENIPPPTPQMIYEGQVYEAKKKMADFLEKAGNLTDANRKRNSQEYWIAHDSYIRQRSIFKARENLSNKLSGEIRNKTFIPEGREGHYIAAGFAAAATGSLGLVKNYFERKSALKDTEEDNKLKNRELRVVRPEWEYQSTSEEKLRGFINGVKSLPPINSLAWVKFNGIYGNDKEVCLEKIAPSYTAEQQVEEIMDQRRRYDEAGEYLYEYSIQGRMPEEFKIVPMTLLINSSDRKNWVEYLKKCPQDLRAPVICDDLDLGTNLNSSWKKIRGRTRFFMSSFVGDPEGDVLEEWEYEDPQMAELERELEEKERIKKEMMFVQRAAFAMHAKNGTLPSFVKKNKGVIDQGPLAWNDLDNKMRILLKEYNIEIGKAEWISEKKNNKHSKGLPDKKDAIKVGEEMNRLEEAKINNPSLKIMTSALMEGMINRVDFLLGIRDLS
jgi:hypothetical protein